MEWVDDVRFVKEGEWQNRSYLIEDKRVVAEVDCPENGQYGYICERFFDLQHQCGRDEYPEPRFTDLASTKEWCEQLWLERLQLDSGELKFESCQ
jgi:hypothetical protein